MVPSSSVIAIDGAAAFGEVTGDERNEWGGAINGTGDAEYAFIRPLISVFCSGTAEHLVESVTVVSGFVGGAAAVGVGVGKEVEFSSLIKGSAGGGDDGGSDATEDSLAMCAAAAAAAAAAAP